MKRYISKYAICPFYKHESTQMIDCCGLEEGTVIHIGFGDAARAKIYKANHCRSGYKKCPIYITLERGKK